MQHHPSRSEKREERYSIAKERGQKSIMDSLYKSEIKKLNKSGYTINVVSPHPKHKNLSLCEVYFPEAELTQN